jgi:hypothetical protein
MTQNYCIEVYVKAELEWDEQKTLHEWEERFIDISDLNTRINAIKKNGLDFEMNDDNCVYHYHWPACRIIEIRWSESILQ